jgi:hypothetical protein
MRIGFRLVPSMFIISFTLLIQSSTWDLYGVTGLIPWSDSAASSLTRSKVGGIHMLTLMSVYLTEPACKLFYGNTDSLTKSHSLGEGDQRSLMAQLLSEAVSFVYYVVFALLIPRDRSACVSVKPALKAPPCRPTATAANHSLSHNLLRNTFL